jgi:hypothetical protein
MPDQDRNAATFGALFGLLVCCAGLLSLAALVIPDILFVMLVLAGLIGLGALQYVVWGWRLDRYRVADDEELPSAMAASENCLRGLKRGVVVGPVVGLGLCLLLLYVPVLSGMLPADGTPQPLLFSFVCWGVPVGALTGSLIGTLLDLHRQRDRSSFVQTLAITCLWMVFIGFPLLLIVKSQQ